MPRSKQNSIIPAAPLGRILMNVGAKRVSADAMETLADILEEKGTEIARKALELSKHTGRKTIHEEDIKLAARR